MACLKRKGKTWHGQFSTLATAAGLEVGVAATAADTMPTGGDTLMDDSLLFLFEGDSSQRQKRKWREETTMKHQTNLSRDQRTSILSLSGAQINA